MQTSAIEDDVVVAMSLLAAGPSALELSKGGELHPITEPPHAAWRRRRYARAHKDMAPISEARCLPRLIRWASESFDPRTSSPP